MPRSKLPTPKYIRKPREPLKLVDHNTSNTSISKIPEKNITYPRIEENTYIEVPPTPPKTKDSDVENDENLNIIAGSPNILNPTNGKNIDKFDVSLIQHPLVNSTPKSIKCKDDNLLDVPVRQTRLRNLRQPAEINDNKSEEVKKLEVTDVKCKSKPSYMNTTAANKYKRVSQNLRNRKVSGGNQIKRSTSKTSIVSKSTTTLSNRVKRPIPKSSFSSVRRTPPKSPRLKSRSPISQKIYKVNQKIKNSKRRQSIIRTKNQSINKSELAEVTSPLTTSRNPSGDNPTIEISWRKELRELKKTDKTTFNWKKFDNKKQLSVYALMCDRGDEKLNKILDLIHQIDSIGRIASIEDGIIRTMQLLNQYKNDKIALDNELSSLQIESENYSSEIEKVKNENLNFKNKVDTLELQNDEDFSRIEESTRRIDNLESELVKSQAVVTSLEQSNESLKKEMEINLEKQQKELSRNHENNIKDIEHENNYKIRDFERKIKELQSEHAWEIKNLKLEHSKNQLELQRKTENELEKQRFENQSIYNENNFIKDEAFKTQNRLTSKNGELEKELIGIKSQLSLKESDNQVISSRLADVQAQSKLESDLKDLAIKDLKNAFKTEKQTLTKNHETKIRQLESKITHHEEELTRITKVKTKLQESLENLQKSTEKANKIAGQDSEVANREIGILKTQLEAANSNSDYLIKNKDVMIQTLRDNEARLEEKLSSLGINLETVHKNLASVQQQSSQKHVEANQLEINLNNYKLKCESLEESEKMYKELAFKHDRRARALNETVCQLKGTIRVMIRIRPLLGDKETGSGMDHIRFSYDKNGRDQVTITNQRGIEHSVSVDKILQPSTSQDDVFSEIESMIQSALDGHHVCIFAYGQTGSGKTFSMEGPENVDENSRGIIPRAMDMILTLSGQDSNWDYEFTANYIESYIEKVYDLLSQDPTRPKITVRVDSTSISFTPKLENIKITNMSDVNKVIKTAHKKRRTSCTNFNARSSRSHSVFMLNIFGKNKTTGKVVKCTVQLIDLAGSENAKDSGQSEGQGFLEAQAINKSLIALSQVINKVRSKSSHVNFRDSELTKILMPSITESSKMLMMVHLNPCIDQVGQSIFSAKFAESTNITKIGKSKIKAESINATFG